MIFNWTNVELKLLFLVVRENFLNQFLIEPMWNWNETSGEPTNEEEVFNWTNVELKQNQIVRRRRCRINF